MKKKLEAEAEESKLEIEALRAQLQSAASAKSQVPRPCHCRGVSRAHVGSSTPVQHGAVGCALEVDQLHEGGSAPSPYFLGGVYVALVACWLSG